MLQMMCKDKCGTGRNCSSRRKRMTRRIYERKEKRIPQQQRMFLVVSTTENVSLLSKHQPIVDDEQILLHQRLTDPHNTQTTISVAHTLTENRFHFGKLDSADSLNVV